MMGNNFIDVGRTVPQRMSSCLATMDIFLQQPHPVLASRILFKKHKTNGGSENDLVAIIANVFGVKDVNIINPNSSLTDLGMDSLMSTEIKQILERNYDIVLSVQEIGMLTFAKLQEFNTSMSGEIEKEQQSLAANATTAANSNVLLMQ